MSVRLSIEITCDDDDLTVAEATDALNNLLASEESEFTNPELRAVRIF